MLNQHSTNGQEELDVFRRPGLQLDVESREEELGGGGGADFWLSKILVGTKKTWTGQRGGGCPLWNGGCQMEGGAGLLSHAQPCIRTSGSLKLTFLGGLRKTCLSTERPGEDQET